MKKIIPLILILGIITGSYAFADDTNQTAFCNAEISIDLKEPKKEIKTNDPVIVTIQIKNTSTNEVLLFRMENVPADFTWVITSPSGKDFSPTNSFPEWGSGWLPKLKPLETRVTDCDLSSVCRFNETGTYRVIGKKEVFVLSPVRKKFEIVSKRLDIVISK